MGRDNYPYLPLTESQFKSLKDGDMPGKEKYEIRQRIQHTLMNGSAIWTALGIDQTTFKTVDAHKNASERLDQSDIDDTKQLQQGLIGWLAFCYAGIEERPHLKRPGKPEPNSQMSREGPNTYFDFEVMLREAINKVENRRGRYVTDLSLEIETEPIPDSPVGDFDIEELLTRFNERDPTLTGLEIAHLQREDMIDDSDWERYTEEAYDFPDYQGGMVGQDNDISQDLDRT